MVGIPARLGVVAAPLGATMMVLAALSAWASDAPEPGVTALPAGVGTVTPSPTAAPGPFTNPLFIPPELTSPDIAIDIVEACVPILPGPCTNMWTYGGTFPGPTIRRPTAETTHVTFTNDLPAAAGEMTVHNHGNHSSSENDGQSHHYLIPAGQSLMYTYEHMEDGGAERGATQWYHDHRMDVTGRNVWNGLAGMYLIDDPADPQTLPSGANDLPLILTDRQFDSSNQIPYTFNENGVFGDTMLVNGRPQPFLEVGDAKYRFRILDASNARVYNLVLSNGDSFDQIGTESGLLPAAIARADMTVAPSERLDVVIDFNGRLGQTFYLRDTFSGIDLVEFRVTQDVTDDSTVPATLRPIPDIGEPTVTRTFNFGRTSGHWTINGNVFDPDRIDAQPVLGTTEEWVFIAGGGSSHVFHLHGVDQQCISRNFGPCLPYETTKEAWLLSSGERLEVKVKFTDHTGAFMFHCHLLEHGDDGMMTQIEVVSGTPTPTPTPSATATPTPSPTPSPTPTPTETPPPTGDTDGDGVADAVEAACGSDPQGETSVPERVDGIFQGQDDDGDTQIDEPLPGAAAGQDCDGDGYTGSLELSIFAPVTDRDQDPCGLDGWPSNLVDGDLGANRADIQDVVGFVAPYNHMGTSPGDAYFDARWDLVPGQGFSIGYINIHDIMSLVAGAGGYPPMFGGERAFGHDCPWPG